MVLEITLIEENKTYSINGSYSGVPLSAEATKDDTVSLVNFYTGRKNPYKTKSSFADFSIGGVTPTSADNAVQLINAITNFSKAGGAAVPTPPAGSDGEIQINSGGSFGVVPNTGFKYDSTNESVDLNETQLNASANIVKTVLFDHDFEGGDLTGFTTSGNVPWFASTTSPIDGTYSAQSGAITHSQTSVLTKSTGVLTDPLNLLTFSYYVSCEKLGDAFLFSVDDGSGKELYLKGEGVLADGEETVKTVYYLFPAGSYDFTWEYIKDSNTTIGQDLVRIDNVSLKSIKESFIVQGIARFLEAAIFDGTTTFNGDSIFNNLVKGNFRTSNDIVVGIETGSGVNFGHGPGTHSGNYTNTVAGFESGKSHKETATHNTYLGNSAGGKIENSGANVAVGSFAMGNSVSPNSCTAVGYQALQNVNGDDNIGIGKFCLKTLTDGNNNIGIGYQCMPSATTASRNLILGGINTGFGIIDGTGNIIIDNGTGNVNVGNISNHVQFYREGVLFFQVNDSNEYTIPLQTNALIDSAGNKSIITKEYLDSRVTGVVIGPNTSVTGNVPTYSNTTGDLIGDSGVNLTNIVKTDVANSYTKQQNIVITTLTAGATIAWDGNDNQNAKLTLTQNATLSNMTNVVEGGSYRLFVNVGTAPFTLSYGANYVFGDDGTPILSTTANKVDRLLFEGTSTGKLSFIGIIKGFSE